MDAAVGLVETYLRWNGYFTVTEFPVLEALRRGGVRTVTDLDVLAIRFPRAGGAAPVRRRRRDRVPTETDGTDPCLRAPRDAVDMLVGEVKRGPAQLNAAARDRLVLETMLARYGCCAETHVPRVVEEIVRHGRTTTPCGHVVRLVAFGMAHDGGVPGADTVVPLGRVVAYLEERVRREWDTFRNAQVGDPVLGLLAVIERARRNGKISRPSPTPAPAGLTNEESR